MLTSILNFQKCQTPVKKPVVKAHGSSDEKLFYYTIKQAENFAKSGTVDIIKKEFEKNI